MCCLYNGTKLVAWLANDLQTFCGFHLHTVLGLGLKGEIDDIASVVKETRDLNHY